jgi:hypothetical protein
MQVQIQGADGPKLGTIIAESQVGGRPFVIVDLGMGAYIKGVYTKFAVVPVHLVMDRIMPDKAEVVEE